LRPGGLDRPWHANIDLAQEDGPPACVFPRNAAAWPHRRLARSGGRPRMGLLALLSPLVLASTAANSASSCTEITGWEQILARDETRWIVIGETHGSNEVPELFTDAVCLTAQSRRVVVGVEQPVM